MCWFLMQLANAHLTLNTNQITISLYVLLDCVLLFEYYYWVYDIINFSDQKHMGVNDTKTSFAGGSSQFMTNSTCNLLVICDWVVFMVHISFVIIQWLGSFSVFISCVYDVRIFINLNMNEHSYVWYFFCGLCCSIVIIGDNILAS